MRTLVDCVELAVGVAGFLSQDAHVRMANAASAVKVRFRVVVMRVGIVCSICGSAGWTQNCSQCYNIHCRLHIGVTNTMR